MSCIVCVARLAGPRVLSGWTRTGESGHRASKPPSLRGSGRGWRGWQPKQTQDDAFGELDIEGCSAGELDREPLDRAEIAERQRPGWRPRRDRPVAATGGEEPGAVAAGPPPPPLYLP